MRLSRWAAGAMLAFLPAAALGQTPPDVAALAKTVQRLSQHVDRLQKEVDQLKAASAPTAAAVASPVVPAKRPAAGKDVSVKGWSVDVIPADDDKKYAVATFSWDKPEFNFGLHTKQVSGHNPYLYRGTASFFPAEQGRYVFQMTLDPLKWSNGGWAFRCAGNLRINGEQVIDAKANALNASGNFDRNGEIFVPDTFSGGAELEPPADPIKGYVLTFEVSCFIDEQDHAQLQDSLFKPWQDNRFTILVKGPDDAAGRPFAGDELFHKGRVKAAR